MLTVRADAKAR